MPRIQIDLPTSLPFTTTLPLYGTHINSRGHLDNALLLTLVSEARTRMISSLGFQESDIDGVGVIVADAAVQYQSEAFHGESMQIAMGAAAFNKYGCDLMWQMRDQATQREIARGKTGIVFFDYEQRRVAPIPPAFLHSLETLAQSDS